MNCLISQNGIVYKQHLQVKIFRVTGEISNTARIYDLNYDMKKKDQIIKSYRPIKTKYFSML